jgi:hypothetical protein
MQSDTRTLLRSGIGIFSTGVIAALLTLTVFGGVSHHGPHTDAGWLSLMLAMGCLPTGLMTLVLAIAKVFGDRSR